MRLLFIAASILIATSAAAQHTTVELDAALNVGYTANDLDEAEFAGLASELRPGIVVQSLSPRLAWRFAYVFAGSLGFDGAWTSRYANQAQASLTADTSKRSRLSLTIGATQGGIAFRLVQTPAEAGQPAIRDQDFQQRVLATAGQGFAYDVSERVRLHQGLEAGWSAPQERLEHYSASAGGSLGLEWQRPLDAFGFDLRPTVSFLEPAMADGARDIVLAAALAGTYRRDLSARWSGRASLGVQPIIDLSGERDAAVLPTGNLTATYLHARGGLSLQLAHGGSTNLETGTVSATDTATAGASWSFGAERQHTLATSAGYLRSRAIREGTMPDAAGIGDAVQADLGLTFLASDSFVLTGRYSLAYQFARPAGIDPALVQVILVGITVRYGNVHRAPPMPVLAGDRVDGADAVGF